MTTTTATAQVGTRQPEAGDAYVGRRYLKLVLVLGALSAIGPLTIDTYLPALPALSTELGASDVQAQTTITGLLLGLGLGQLIVGPLSDAFGRRRPLLIGLSVHALASVLCALAPSIAMLTVTRTLQGLAGAAVAVVAMAMVRDLFSGYRAAQLMSRLVLVLGAAPVLAPSLGSALLTATSWRGIFVVLAAVAVALMVVAFFGLPETLPPNRRLKPSLQATRGAYATLLRDGTFVLLVAVAALVFSTLFAYIAGSPFVLQEIFGLSPQQFGLVFGLNAVGLIISTQVNPVLLRHHSPMRILSVALGVAFAAALVLMIFAILDFGGLLGFALPLAVVLAAIGMSLPNAPAAALSRHGETAGTAAALLGAAQFGIGGLIAPVVGLLSNGTPVPVAAVMATTTGLATALVLLGRKRLRSG